MDEKTIPILKRGPGFEEPSGYSSLENCEPSYIPPLLNGTSNDTHLS